MGSVVESCMGIGAVAWSWGGMVGGVWRGGVGGGDGGLKGIQFLVFVSKNVILRKSSAIVAAAHAVADSHDTVSAWAVSHARSSPMPDHPSSASNSMHRVLQHQGVIKYFTTPTLRLAALIRLKSARLAILLSLVNDEILP